jgi:hypothetical protein
MASGGRGAGADSEEEEEGCVLVLRDVVVAGGGLRCVDEMLEVVACDVEVAGGVEFGFGSDGEDIFVFYGIICFSIDLCR